MQCAQENTGNQCNVDVEIENINQQDLREDSPTMSSDESGKNKENIINDQIINSHSMEVEESDQISQQDLTIEDENPTRNISYKVQMQIDSDQTQKENRTYNAKNKRDLKKKCETCLEMFCCKSIDLHFDYVEKLVMYTTDWYTMQMAKGKKINQSLVSCQGGVVKTCTYREPIII